VRGLRKRLAAAPWRGAAAGACAVFAATATLLSVVGGSAAASVSRGVLSYDPVTQSHPGACSQTTLNVSEAVNDLSANGVLGQYASLVGVRATGNALKTDMRETLMVERVAKTVTTANHGCTTSGLVFSVGSRVLTAGETIGVAMPASVRANLCHGSTSGCERKVLTFHEVFPTNCWNLNQGTVQVVVYVHKAKVVAKPVLVIKSAKPSASVSFACGDNGGTASLAASFTIDGKSYGPVAAGRSLTVLVALSSSTDTDLVVDSGGQALINQTDPPDPCSIAGTSTGTNTTTDTTATTTVAAPSATATVACAVNGDGGGTLTVDLTDGSSATAAADFSVTASGNTSSGYGPSTVGPVAIGSTEALLIPVDASGNTITLTVDSGGQQLLLQTFTFTFTSYDPYVLGTACTAPEQDG